MSRNGHDVLMMSIVGITRAEVKAALEDLSNIRWPCANPEATLAAFKPAITTKLDGLWRVELVLTWEWYHDHGLAEEMTKLQGMHPNVFVYMCERNLEEFGEDIAYVNLGCTPLWRKLVGDPEIAYAVFSRYDETDARRIRQAKQRADGRVDRESVNDAVEGESA